MIAPSLLSRHMPSFISEGIGGSPFGPSQQGGVSALLLQLAPSPGRRRISPPLPLHSCAPSFPEMLWVCVHTVALAGLESSPQSAARSCEGPARVLVSGLTRDTTRPPRLFLFG